MEAIRDETGEETGYENAGTRIRSNNGRRVQVTAIKPTEFTRDKRQLFLDTLAATCNVTTAARVAGIGSHTAYAARRAEPAFASLWEEALDTGYLRLEEQLLARASEALDAIVIDPDAAPVASLPSLVATIGTAAQIVDEGPEPEPGFAVGGGRTTAAGLGGWAGRGLPPAYQLALVLLNRRQAQASKGLRRGHRRVMTTQEVNALLTEKLDRLDRLSAPRSAGAAGPRDGDTTDGAVTEGDA